MMSDISQKDWERIRRHYGDLAYEHPELHKTMLRMLDRDDSVPAVETIAKAMAILDRVPDVPPDPGDELK